MRNIIKKILREESELNELKRLVNSYQPNNIQLALIMSEGFGLKKEVLELIFNRILKEMKLIVGKEPRFGFFGLFNEEVAKLIRDVDKIKINKIANNLVSVNVYGSVVGDEYVLVPLFGEIEEEYKKLVGEFINIIEDTN